MSGTKRLQAAQVNFGCDPEFFFQKAGGVIGAEKVISGKFDKFVLDGVQVELNPSPNPCRANLANSMKANFCCLRDKLAKMDGVTATFSSVIELSKEELDSLSEQAKKFGCAPSNNAYTKRQSSIKVDAAKYLKRSAGGHLHYGLYAPVYGGKPDYRPNLVPVLDILVGNTAVLIDRDPYAAERRKHYGKAGEFRLPAHGLEYRTLSNFWLRSYQLMSLMMGLSRMAISVVDNSVRFRDPKYRGYYFPIEFDFEAELLKMVDIKLVRKAINKNDLELALKNYQGVKEFIQTYVGDRADMGLDTAALKPFDFFLEKLWSKGIEYWFPDDPMTHWCNIPEGHETGAESWLHNKVNRVMVAETKSGVRV